MTSTFNPTGSHTQGKNIQAGDIKALVGKQGKLVIGNQEFTLKNPLATDSKLQAIVNDPSFSVTPIKNANGQAEYELTGAGKSVTISVAERTL